MATKDEIAELIRRVEAATAGSEELGVAVNEALDIASYITDEGNPTESVDAALALVERVLPGWFGSVDWAPPKPTAHLNRDGGPWVGTVEAEGATLPLAILATVLRAHAHQEER